MKLFKYIVLLFAGLICGVILMILLNSSRSSIVEITVDNKSQNTIPRIIIVDNDLSNKYLIEQLKSNSSKKVFLFAEGEIGYKITAELQNGDSLITAVYAESGYKDIFVITNDSIIYKPGTY